MKPSRYTRRPTFISAYDLPGYHSNIFTAQEPRQYSGQSIPRQTREEISLKNHFQGSMYEVINTINIHTVKDIYLARHSPWRLAFWLIVAVAAICIMIDELTGIVSSFMEENIASSMKLWEIEDFPSIIYCPQKFLDPEKSHNLTKPEAMAYAISIVPLASTDLTQMFNATTLIAARTNPKRAKNFLLDSLRSQQITVEELILRASYDANQIFNSTYIGVDRNANLGNWTLDKTITWSGVCYRASVKAATTSFLLSFVHTGLVMTRRFAENGYSFLAFGEDTQRVLPAASVRLAPAVHQRYDVHVTLSSVQRLSSKFRKCSEDSDYSIYGYEQCTTGCVNKKICGACNLWHPAIPDPLSSLCTAFDQGNHCLMKLFRESKQVKGCFDDCPIPCRAERSDAIIIDRSKGQPDDQQIFIRLQNPTDSYRIVQYNTYSSDTLTSNIGGTVSLWFGASIMSLAQLVYYGVAYCCWAMKAKDDNVVVY